MSFDTNVWYSIQNFGSDYFLACQNVGNCVTAESGLSDPELFQLATINGSQPYYIRPKALENDSNGNAYCVNINTGVPAIATCSNESALWGIGNWNGKDAGDGKFFISIPEGDALRLSLDSNSTYSLQNYNNLASSQQNDLQWAVSSRTAINDQSYSTVPAAIAAETSTTNTKTATSTSSASTSQSSSSFDSGSTSDIVSATVSDGSSSTPATTSVPSTVTMLVTPTVTESPPPASAGSGTSTSSAIPSLTNGAERPVLGIKTTLTLMAVIPQIIRLLS